MDNKNSTQKNLVNTDKHINRFYVSPELLQLEWAGGSVALVHGFMLNRYLFFRSKSKAEHVYFESQKVIAKTLGMSEKTVNRCISLLQDHNYLSFTLIHQGKSFKNSYVVHDVNKIMQIATKPTPKVKEKFQWFDDEDNGPF